MPVRQALFGELLGTYLLVLFGTGAVAAAVLTGAQVGLWQVAVVWGFGVTIAIPGPNNGFWVYILGPLVGGPLGGLVWRTTSLEGS